MSAVVARYCRILYIVRGAHKNLNSLIFLPLRGVWSGWGYSRTDLAIHPYIVKQLLYTLSPIVVCSHILAVPKQLPSRCWLTTVKYDLLQYSTILTQM